MCANISADRVIRGAKPLCFYRGQLLIARVDQLALLDLASFAETRLCTLPSSLWRRIVSQSALCYRALRSGVRSALCHDEYLFLTHGRRLYRVDPKTDSCICEFTFRRGKGPLSLTEIKGLSGFEDGLYFGEYFDNASKDSVRIYQRTASGD